MTMCPHCHCYCCFCYSFYYQYLSSSSHHSLHSAEAQSLPMSMSSAAGSSSSSSWQSPRRNLHRPLQADATRDAAPHSTYLPHLRILPYRRDALPPCWSSLLSLPTPSLPRPCLWAFSLSPSRLTVLLACLLACVRIRAIYMYAYTYQAHMRGRVTQR